ncbi:MAG: two-component system, OmpR family, sensor histidine kinase CpxA [Pyrinomonadaceae bacterium]|nr:two-component system, OmpR family, sensor histidine kinase CpxA [Pyrinomonadaceae bacterium]
MHSLFLKVFLWFWLAMALVIAALFLTSELTRSEPQFPSYSGMDRAMTVYGQLAATTYEREGAVGLRKFFGEPQQQQEDAQGDARQDDVRQRGGDNARPGGDAFYLLDAQGAEVTGRVVPRGVAEVSRRALASGAITRGAPGAEMFVAHPVKTESGRTYVLVDWRPRRRPPPGFFSDQPAAQLLRVLAVLLTAGALCYLLARYIVSPVVKLRAVTGQVARGDLSARVSPLLGRRRDELADMGRDFDAMAARIETLVSAQQRLIRDISHELRSPLTRLGVALELARRHTSPQATSALDRIGREAESINEMIGQLLTLSRVESGDAEGLRRVRLDLCALVREIADDADFEARSRARSARATECEPCMTTGVPGLIKSAIENVVRNAVRHTAEGTEVEITLFCEEAGGARQAVVAVRDHGAGVPEETLEEIFRPFYRVGEARDRQTGGAGLGLAIAARATRLHGGTIKASNAHGGGLLVEIKFPASDA